MEEVIVALVALSAVLGTLIGHILARSQGKNNYQDNNHLRAIYGNQPRKPDVTAIIDRSTKTWGIFWWRSPWGLFPYFGGETCRWTSLRWST
jgi:hypothetical protein